MKPNFEMFGIDVIKEITSIESWTKSLKSYTAISSTLDYVTSTLETVFKELKEDFN